MSENSKINSSYEQEFSFKSVLNDRRKDIKYLLGFKKQYLVVAMLGIAAGALTARFWPVTYSARLTFIIEDSKASGGSLLAGLAGQFGLDMGGALGGASGVLAGDNVTALLRSESIIQRTLLSPFPGKKGRSLADQYADSYELKDAWRKYTKDDKPIMFPTDTGGYTRLQDSLLQDMIIRVGESNMSVSKPDKKLGFFEMRVTTPDEKLSQLFSLYIIDQATQFYIQTKTKAQRINVNRLQARADSIGRLLNRKTYSASAANNILLDANPAYPTANVRTELEQRDKMVLQTIYAEIIKNLEVSRTMLVQETPTFQLVDTPQLPLHKNRIKYPKGIIMGLMLAVALYSLFLLAFRKGE
ncbi:MAG: hypothetical protein ACYCZO_01915 [Daejeonella sp.]